MTNFDFISRKVFFICTVNGDGVTINNTNYTTIDLDLLSQAELAVIAKGLQFMEIECSNPSGFNTYLSENSTGSTSGSLDIRYVFLNDSTTTQTTYTVPASAVTEVGHTIIELSNNSLTSITVDTATATGKVAGDSVNISITGTYTAQVLVGSGATLEGDLTFSYQYQTKTLVYKGSNVWKVVG